MASFAGISFESMEERCVEPRREMSSKTQTTRRELVELNPAAETCEKFGDWEGPEEGDAKMLKEREGGIMDGDLVSLPEVPSPPSKTSSCRG